MRRIGLAVILALSFLVAPLAVEAQPQTGKVWRIGVLMSLYPPDADPPQAFRQGLRSLGYVEGQNLVIEWRYAQGRDDRLPGLAAELARLKVDLIAADVTLAIRAAMQATSTIPIVMALTADAMGSGLVPSLGRPGGNVTGLTTMLPELSAKRLQLFKEAVPRISRVAVLWNPALSWHAARERNAVSHCPKAASRVRDQEPAAHDVRKQGVCARGRPHVVWRQFPRDVSACCRICGQDSQRRQTRRPPRGATHQV